MEVDINFGTFALPSNLGLFATRAIQLELGSKKNPVTVTDVSYGTGDATKIVSRLISSYKNSLSNRQ